MKRIVGLMLAAFILLATCAIAAEATGDLTSSLGDFSRYGTGNMVKYDPPIDMSIGIGIDVAKFFPEGESYEDNVWSRAYRDELGINLSLAFATADAESKINTAIAAGDIPDLLQVNISQLMMLVDSGFINQDLYHAYNDNAGEEMRLLLEGVGGNAAIARVTFDGNMVAIPRLNTSAGEEAPMLYLRDDWMEKFGFKDPENYAELREIMVAFTKQDPDGNGVDDTYGLPFTKEPWNYAFQMHGFFNIFGAYPNSWVDDPENPGQVVYGAFQPESKDALAELRDLYAEGILDKEFAIKDVNAAAELIASGKVGAAICIVWSPNNFLNANVANDPNADWHAIPVPGLNSPTTPVTAFYPISSYFVFNADFEHPEALVKIINLHYAKCFSEDTTLETYEKYVETSKGPQGYQPFLIYPWGNYMPAIKNERAAELINQGVPSDELPIFAQAFGRNVEQYEAGDTSLWGWYRFFGPRSGHLVTGRYIREDLYYMSRYYGPNTPTMSENMSLVTQLVNEMIVKIIMGEEPLDSFEAYKAQADELGLAAMTEEANAWLAESNANAAH